MLKSCWDRDVAVYDQAVGEALLDAIVADAEGIARSPNFWVPMESIMQPSTAAEAAISALHRRVLQQHPRCPPALTGAEWWVQVRYPTPPAHHPAPPAHQVYRPGAGLAFHFDKDEAGFKDTGNMRHPALSSVLYLTGAAEGPPQGPTVVMRQHFDNERRCTVPEDPEACCIAWPIRGRYLVFDGRLGHGVLESTNQSRRITLLVNWWEGAPPQVTWWLIDMLLP